MTKPKLFTIFLAATTLEQLAPVRDWVARIQKILAELKVAGQEVCG